MPVAPNSARRAQSYVPYFIAVFLRFVFIFCHGYIHPDEFFQFPSPMSNLVFGKGRLTWEWTRGVDSQRSVVIPFLICGVPFYFLRMLCGTNSVSGRTLLYVPRFVVFFLSIGVDVLVGRIGSRLFPVSWESPFRVRCLVRSWFVWLWPVMLFHSRTFSNTVECFMLALALYVGCCCWKKRPFLRNTCLGAVVCMGFFTRFTFGFFVLPVCVWSVVIEGYLSSRSSGRLNIGSLFFAFAGGCIDFLSGFFLVFAGFAWCDSVYFSEGIPMWVVTPLNNLLYNLDPANLALHTLHPRFLHAFVNLPVLFGPAWILAIVSTMEWLTARNRFPSPGPRAGFFLCLATLFSGVGFLSLAPHQEARFLVPLSIPVALLCAWSSLMGLGRSKLMSLCRFLATWFALFVAIFFGVFHQSGVTRVLVDASSLSAPPSTELAFYRTYMAPAYLLQDSGHEIAEIEELKVIQPAQLLVYSKSEERQHEAFFSQVSCVMERSYWGHWSSEALPSRFSDLRLVVARCEEKSGFS